jgi:hypothetical protein
MKKAVTEVESPHPYNPNMDEYWTVEVSGGERIPTLECAE